MPVRIPVIATSMTTGEVVRFESVTSAARVGGFDRSCVHACIHGQRKSHNGFTFITPVKLRPVSNQTLIHKVADLANCGLSIKQIAAELRLSVSTVRNRMPMARNLGLLNEVE
ncbi:hypothetical protein [Aeromonas phage Asp37]|nr:hypothetical protein [Aeromonas phage Asp37]